MKFNWGVGAFTLFGGFVIFIISMVFLASGQSHELVTENYYEKELAFKEVLKQKARTNSLDQATTVEVSNKQLNIVLPTGKQATKGTILLFKPSAQKDDRLLSFKGANNAFDFDLNSLNNGMYKMKIQWEVGGVVYFHEQKIDL